MFVFIGGGWPLWTSWCSWRRWREGNITYNCAVITLLPPSWTRNPPSLSLFLSLLTFILVFPLHLQLMEGHLFFLCHCPFDLKILTSSSIIIHCLLHSLTRSVSFTGGWWRDRTQGTSWRTSEWQHAFSFSPTSQKVQWRRELRACSHHVMKLDPSDDMYHISQFCRVRCLPWVYFSVCLSGWGLEKLAVNNTAVRIASHYLSLHKKGPDITCYDSFSPPGCATLSGSVSTRPIT